MEIYTGRILHEGAKIRDLSWSGENKYFTNERSECSKHCFHFKIKFVSLNRRLHVLQTAHRMHVWPVAQVNSSYNYLSSTSADY